MQVVLLGTGTPVPNPDRAGPATLVRAGGLDLLFDCGRGVIMRLAGAGIMNPATLPALFVTHLHSDHTTALSDLLTTRWIMHLDDSPLRVIGPEGTERYCDDVLAAMAQDIQYRLDHHATLDHAPSCDVTEVSEGVVFDEHGVTVTAALVDHAPVRPALGYRIEHDGKSVVVSGDSVPCEGLDKLCAGADVYVQAVLRRSVIEAIPLPRLQDILTYHSDLEGTGRTAATAGVTKVVLTHLMFPPMGDDSSGWEQEWVDEVAAVYDGEVVVGEDLMTIEV